MKTSLTALPFAEAAKVWLETRKPYLAEKTYRDYNFCLKSLNSFFGEMHLQEIDAEQIRAYQRSRTLSVGASMVNQECSILQQMLKRIGRWAQIAPDYQPMRLPRVSRGRALSEHEYVSLFRAASANENWEAAYLFALISVNTTAGPKEIMTLRLADVDLEERFIAISDRGVKNAYRVRHIPLNDEATKAASRALARAKGLGSVAPEHFLFPFRLHRNCYDPERHQTTFKTAWKEMCAAAGIVGFRMYDLRHHAITALLENPEVSEETAEAIAGHISHEIKRRYSHIRMEYKRKAVESLKQPWKKRA